MPIRLDKIILKNLGPLESLDLTLGSLNLIYGPNETGKTCLVEFLLGSIFRQASNWGLRNVPGKGSVTVSGLTESPTSFTLTTKKKIEDYWEEDELGLPLNIARLLVVKGGELDLTGSPGGVNRDVLKTALTSEALLDQIRKPISKTIQKASIRNQEIMGDNRSSIKNLRELSVEIQKLKVLGNRVENEYSQGPLRQLEIKIERIQDELLIQEQAKYHTAYILRQDLNTQKIEKNNLSDEILEDLRDLLRDFTKDQEMLAGREKNLKKYQEASEHFPWLESAISIWENRSLDGSKKPSRRLTIIGMSFLMAGLTLLGINDLVRTINLFWIGLPIALFSAGILFYSIVRLQQWTASINEGEERQSIQEEYKTRFGKTLRGLSVLKEKKNSLQKSYFQVEPLKKEIQENIADQMQKKSSLQELLKNLTGKTILEKDWEKTYQNLKKKSDQHTEQIRTLELELKKLNLPEERTQDEPVDEEYSPQRVNDLQVELNSLQIQLKDAQHTLESLKGVICHETHDDVTIPWEEALYHFRSIAEKKERNYRELTARLIAEIGVIQILDRFEKEEDQKIQRDLNTNEVSALLQSITGSYQTLDLIDDQIYVSDQYSQYALSDLSTGAREQVQLALRMGLATRVTGGDPLFLILDDAFQHSDWTRREHLVNQVISLVKNGWQVIYLTMDDHIRDLFQKYGKSTFKKQYLYHELN